MPEPLTETPDPGAARRIEDLAQESKALVRDVAEAVNRLADAGRIPAGEDLQPERLNALCTRAIFCADEITRLARALSSVVRETPEGRSPARRR